jgi:hypothetical protein
MIHAKSKKFAVFDRNAVLTQLPSKGYTNRCLDKRLFLNCCILPFLRFLQIDLEFPDFFSNPFLFETLQFLEIDLVQKI